MSLVFFILILVVLILVHEFGHFVVAKLFGVRVDEFGIGFPPRLLMVSVGETLYSLNLLLFGGFVKIFGENQKEGKGDPRALSSKLRSVQAAVLVAGVLFNLLFAWLVFSAGYVVGLPTSASYEGLGQVREVYPTIVGVLSDSPAAAVGLLPKDRIVALETGTTPRSEVTTANFAREFIGIHQDESVVLTVLRNGEEKVFLARAKEGILPERKVIGIELDDVGILQLPLPEALVEGFALTVRTTGAVAVGLSSFFADLVRGLAQWGDVAGPIGIANIGSRAVGEGFVPIVLLTALISINLALINLVPIPGLDGGRLLIIAIEALLRREIPERLILGLTVAGLALLITLMLFISYHDVVRLVG